MVASTELMVSLATLSGVIITTSGVAWRMGLWKKEMEGEHSDMMDAHAAMHKDIQKIVDEVNGDSYSNREQCEVCDEIEQAD